MQFKWVDDMVAAFLRLPRGLRPLTHEIYQTVAQVRAEHEPVLSADWKFTNWKSTIREKLQEHSSDYPHHWTEKRPDYFYSGGRRSGLWGLRDQYWPREPQIVIPPEKIWVPTPQDGYLRYPSGTLEQLALPETVRELAYLNEYVNLCNERDPRVGIRVMLYEKPPP